MSMSAYETFIHLATCATCRQWYEVCGRRSPIMFSEEGTVIPLPQGGDREYLCEEGKRLVDGRDDQ
jgi:predicted anti-sigma-YlaC factor YlaD